MFDFIRHDQSVQDKIINRINKKKEELFKQYQDRSKNIQIINTFCIEFDNKSREIE